MALLWPSLVSELWPRWHRTRVRIPPCDWLHPADTNRGRTDWVRFLSCCPRFREASVSALLGHHDRCWCEHVNDG